MATDEGGGGLGKDGGDYEEQGHEIDCEMHGKKLLECKMQSIHLVGSRLLYDPVELGNTTPDLQGMADATARRDSRSIVTFERRHHVHTFEGITLYIKYSMFCLVRDCNDLLWKERRTR